MWVFIQKIFKAESTHYGEESSGILTGRERESKVSSKRKKLEGNGWMSKRASGSSGCGCPLTLLAVFTELLSCLQSGGAMYVHSFMGALMISKRIRGFIFKCYICALTQPRLRGIFMHAFTHSRLHGMLDGSSSGGGGLSG